MAKNNNKKIIKKTVTLGGEEVPVFEKELPIDTIQLDVENPRIGYFKDNQQQTDLNEDSLKFVLTQANEQEYNKLKNSIEANHGIVNPIWVFESEDKRDVVVVDGNSRLLIYRDLNKKYPNDPKYKSIKCLVVPSRAGVEEKADFVRLLFHLRGSNDWDAYAKAKYLYHLFFDGGKSYDQLTDLTKLNSSQIEQSIKAYKAMVEQFLPGYKGTEIMTGKFSYFVEYFKNKVDVLLSSVGLGIENFCEWIYKGELTNAQHVRRIPKIFKNEEAKRTLVDKGYSAAFEQLTIYKPSLSSKLFDAIEEVTNRLKDLTRDEIKDIAKEDENEEKRKLLSELNVEVKEIVNKFD